MASDQYHTALLATAYLPPVHFYNTLLAFDNVIIEKHEHFPKQTYRNRCVIYGANGPLALSIPLIKRKEHTPIKDVCINYDFDWQKLHWRSLEAAYRRSPFFEFYEDELAPFFKNKQHAYLMDWNEALMKAVNELLELNINFSYTEKYEKEYAEINDFRALISPKIDFGQDKGFVPQSYTQVFENKHGFIPNLSIVDLLFSQGPNTLSFLKSQNTNFK